VDGEAVSADPSCIINPSVGENNMKSTQTFLGRFNSIFQTRTPLSIGITGLLLSLIFLYYLPDRTGGYVDSLFKLTDDIVEYFVFAIGFFTVFWVILNKFLGGRKLTQNRWPKLKQVVSEVIYSLITQFIFLTVVMWIVYLVTDGRISQKMYGDVSDYGIPYYALTIFIMFFVHDTFFYWSHRLMHWGPIFRLVHKTHHESRDPTPFTTFHFHPIEAVVEAIAGKATILVLLVMPWHESIPAIWAMGMILFNTIGHLGFEIYPSWWNKVPIINGKTTASHHYMHHQRVKGNYALYFRFWDKLCKTEFEDYEQRYDAMFEKIRDEKKNRRAASASTST
jgi:lathosterol oxidase